MEWVIVVLLVVIVGLLLYVALRPQQKMQDARGELLMLQQQLQELSRGVEHKLGEGAKSMSESVRMQFDQSQRLMSQIKDSVSQQLIAVTKEISETKEGNKQVFTIAGQLQNLEKVLTHQKQRGAWGEASLELILANMLPPNSFKIQYEFPGGETVDAAIVTPEGIIPIDAKFSMDNYARLANAVGENERTDLEKAFKNDLKLRIDETSKYVRPKDGTLPFAFMYIPAEGIYYDLLTNEVVGATKANARSLIDYAHEKKVIIVSPTTFAAYLNSVLYGFKAFKIAEQAKDISKNVEALGKHLKAYEEYYTKLGNSIQTTSNHYNAGKRELGKIDKDVLRITGSSPELDTSLLAPQQLDGVE